MDIHPRFNNDTSNHLTSRLKKSLHGLKQSHKAWFKKFTKAVVKCGFKQTQSDHTLFLKLT